jgi:hypothetical protein
MDAFTDVGLDDMGMSPTPGGSVAVHGHPVIGSVAAVQASAATRVSLPVPPGMEAKRLMRRRSDEH